jgi:hypothetical protein
VILLATSCNSKPDPSHLAKVAKDAGVAFPSGAELLVEDSLAGGLGLWVIRGNERFTLPGEKLVANPTDVRTELERHISISSIGELTDPMADRWNWENTNGRWRASSVRGTGGYFLHLEQFAKP